LPFVRSLEGPHGMRGRLRKGDRSLAREARFGAEDRVGRSPLMDVGFIEYPFKSASGPLESPVMDMDPGDFG